MSNGTAFNNRVAARQRLAKEIAPLLTECAATYFGDPARPNFAYSELGIAIKTVMMVLDAYADMPETNEHDQNR